MITKIKKYINIPLLLLIMFPFYFGYDLYRGNLFFSHNDYSGMYYPFRQWFLENLMDFKFPIWNPYWGIGHEAVIWATVPVDFYSILEIFIKPHYEYFFILQCMALVIACYCAFRKFGFESWASTISSLFFFMSPLITYWSFEFIKTNLFIAHIFTFFFMVKWFETRKLCYVFLMGWAFFLGMFGTKLEFWFFGTVFFILCPTITFFLMIQENRWKKLHMIFFAWGSIILAIAAQSWQVNLLVNALNNSNRQPVPHGLHNLFSFEMYRNIFLSLGDSDFFALMLISIFLIVGLHKQVRYRWFFLGLAIFASLLFKAWGFSFLAVFIKSPIFIGGLLATSLAIHNYSKRDMFSAWTLFMLPAYYWCRPMVNVDELYLLGVAPIFFKGIWGFLVWFGCLQVLRHKVALIAYLSIIMVLVLEVQGQIVLSYLFGYLWMPARDNYIIDFSFALLVVFGLLTRFRFKITVKRLAPFIIVFAGYANLYYVIPLEFLPGIANPLLREGLPYNPFTGDPELNNTINNLDYKPYRRVVDPDIDPQLPQNHGAFLRKQTNNATFYGSMTPLRYSELVNYHKYGITPADNITGYPSVYSKKTISRLPNVENKDFNNGLIYYMTVWTIPPLELDLLQMLGVDHIITRNKNLVSSSVQKLNLVDEEYLGTFNIAKLANTLPRTFLVTNVTEENLNDFKENMKPNIKMYDKVEVDQFYSNDYIARSAEFLKYEPEYVSIEAKSAEGGYLVLSDVFHPYWSAKVDGKSVEIIPAFHAFRGVKVPAGSHKVEFFCNVPHFKTAFLVSIILVVASSLFTLRFWKKEI